MTPTPITSPPLPAPILPSAPAGEQLRARLATVSGLACAVVAPELPLATPGAQLSFESIEPLYTRGPLARARVSIRLLLEGLPEQITPLPDRICAELQRPFDPICDSTQQPLAQWAELTWQSTTLRQPDPLLAEITLQFTGTLAFRQNRA